MMIDEGRLSLDDRVAGFFPEYVPENPSPYVLQATVRDLLTMATFNETNAYDWDSPDFVRTFFDNPYPKHKAGTIFHYDTAATVKLCGIV
jgi:CubicO group peptidase (beta-lactamase class C family)